MSQFLIFCSSKIKMEEGRAASHFLPDSRNIDQKQLTCWFLQNNKHNQSMEIIILIHLKSLKILNTFFQKTDAPSSLKTNGVSTKYMLFWSLSFQEMLSSVVSQKCFSSCSPGSYLWPFPLCCWKWLLLETTRWMNDQTNKIHVLGITWWWPAVQGMAWKQYLLWANVSPGSA